MRFFDRVAQFTATTGQGAVTLGTAISNSMLTLAEAGASDGDVITFLIEEGDDFEISRGVVSGGGTVVARDTVQTSKIGGVAGTAKLELAGSGKFRVVETADSLNRFEANIGYQALLPEIVKTAGWTATIAEAGRMLVYNSAAGGSVTLPTVATSDGEVYHYRCANAGSLTIDGNSSETVEGAATLVLPRGCSALVWANDGKTGWRVMVSPPPAVARLAGAAGAFLRYTGPDSGVMQAIVAAVSQSGGVPTGGIVEYGSNANGEYVRLAGGLQICWTQMTLPYLSAGALGASWTFPAVFSAAARVIGNAMWQTAAGALSASSYQQYPGPQGVTATTTVVSLRMGRMSGAAFASGDSVACDCFAIGKWN